MIDKTTSEIQDIFVLDRNDVRRLEGDGVLKPEKNGQGKVSMYGPDDMDRLLDIKMYLLAGYKISDMKNIINDDYDSEKSIDEQINEYQKRIKMLQFIRDMRADIRNLEKLSRKQLQETGTISAEKTNLPEFGSNEYIEFFWKYIKLIFTVDYLSQKATITDNSKAFFQRFFSAFSMVESILKLSETELNLDELSEVFRKISSATTEEDIEVRALIKELIKEYLSNQEQVMQTLMDESIIPITNALDKESGEIYKDMSLHIFQFVLDYFLNEEGLYCIYLNLKKFIKELDQEALAKGLISFEGER